jgi:hypothetical protein
LKKVVTVTDLLIPDGFRLYNFTAELFDDNFRTWQLFLRAQFSYRRSDREQQFVANVRALFCNRVGEPRFNIDPTFRKPIIRPFHLMVFTKHEPLGDRIVSMRVDDEYHPEFGEVYLDSIPEIKATLLGIIHRGHAIECDGIPAHVFYPHVGIAGCSQPQPIPPSA